MNAIGINPYHPSIYYNLGIAQLQVYRMNGNYRYFQSAEDNLDKAVMLAVNNPLYPYQAAKVLMAVAALLGGAAHGIALHDPNSLWLWGPAYLALGAMLALFAAVSECIASTTVTGPSSRRTQVRRRNSRRSDDTPTPAPFEGRWDWGIRRRR